MACTRSTAGSSEVSVLLVVTRWFDLRAYCLVMGDFPRWIDREDVDSAAMYSAYLAYDYVMKQKYSHIIGACRPVWHGHLHIIDHKKPDIEGICLPRDAPWVRQVDCRQQPCRRCDEKSGGYQFRWFSPYWAKFYNLKRREGSWKAPIGDHETATSASLRFWEEIG